MESKTIYTKHYPRKDPMEELKEANEKYADEADLPDFMKRTPEKLLRILQEKYRYEPRADKLKEAENFIAYAKYLSSLYQIDTEITRDEVSVKADFWIAYSLYGKTTKNRFMPLFVMADELSLAPDDSWPYGFILTMTYNTADLYADGRKVDS